MYDVCNKRYCLRFFTRICDSEGFTLEENQIARFDYSALPPIPHIGETVIIEDITPQIYKVTGVEYAYPYQCVEDEAREHDICVIVEETY